MYIGITRNINMLLCANNFHARFICFVLKNKFVNSLQK